MEIAFLITTYERPRSCKELIKKIAPYGDIYLINDGSKTEYKITKSLLRGHSITYMQKPNGGKQRYWDTVNRLFALPDKDYDYYFMIPDDFIPVSNFVKKSIYAWENINDRHKICINTFVGEGRLGKKNWTNFNPIELDNCRLTQWVDMCFLCEKKFFDSLGTIPEINMNWDKRPELSSGVGSHISKHLISKGFNIYQTKTSMFKAQKEAFDSKMNGWRQDQSIHKAVL